MTKALFQISVYKLFIEKTDFHKHYVQSKQETVKVIIFYLV